MRAPMLTQHETRALAVKTVLDTAWQTKQGATLKQERDGMTLHVEVQPELRANKRGESVAISVMVRLFDEKGSEAKIDPHRVIVNPPTQIVITEAEYDKEGNETKARVLQSDPEAAFWEVLWQSVTTVPGVVKR